MEYSIKIKDAIVFQKVFEVSWHPILVDLFQWIQETLVEEFPIITSAYRKNDKGVRGTDPLRGLDIRGKGKEAIEKVEKINSHWEYDSSRPHMKCAIVHNVGKGEHIHLQVHPNTVIIKGGW
jgi:hypothetical protein